MSGGAFLTRREFAALLLGASATAGWAAPERPALDFKINPAGFDAGEADIRAVIASAANEIWKHCATARFEFGFQVYRNQKYPITHYEREDARVVIGLNTNNTYWSQYAYQFAHEFCHALMDHSQTWRRAWITGDNSTQWVEETLCETGSLFALRAMAKSWETKPPYRHWASYAPKLADYARKRMEEPQHQLPEGKAYAEWFKETEPLQRKKWTREANTIAAIRLLPLFEAEPAGWDALPFANLGAREAGKPLSQYLDEWKTNAPADLRPFVGKLGKALVSGIS